MTDKEIELALETIALVLEDLKKTQEKQQATITAIKELLASPQRTEQLKACVYCGQLVVKEKNT